MNRSLQPKQFDLRFAMLVITLICVTLGLVSRMGGQGVSLLLMLLALGCADQGTSTPAPDAGTDSTTTVEPAETEADLTKVSLTVTGMR